MHTRACKDSLFREKKKEKKEREGGRSGGENQRLTDPRAGVRFRFNVSLHVHRGAVGVGGTGEELG